MKLHGRTAFRQRGSIIIIAAAVLLVSLLATALAVDIGRIAWEQRRLQLVADLAALEAAKTIADCRNAGGILLSLATTAANTSATRNGYSGNPLVVRVGNVTTDTNGIRTFAASPGEVQAVEVTASKLVPRSLVLPVGLAGTHRLTAVAVGRDQTVATLEVGSFLVRVDTSTSPLLNALLGGLLGSSVNLDLVSYQGIADTNIKLLDLIKAQGSVGTVDELLNLTMTVGEFKVLIAEAVSNDPSKATVAADLLGIPVSATLTDAIRVGDVLDVQTPRSPAALAAEVNALSLLMVAAEVANTKHAVEAALALPLAGIADATLHLYVVEPPQIAVGPAGRDADGEWITRAHNSQVHVQLDLSILPGLLSAATGGGLVNLNLVVELAETRAGLERFECRGNPEPAVIVGAVPNVARIGIGKFDDLTKLNPTIEPSQVLNVLGLIGVTAKAQLTVGDSTSDPEYLDFETFPETQTTSAALGTSLATVLGDLATDLEVKFDGALGPVLNLLLQPLLSLLGLGSANGILDLVTALLQPIINALSPILDLLFDLLGLQLGGADITILDVSVGRPELVR